MNDMYMFFAWIVIAVLAFIAPFAFMILLHLCIYLAKGRRFKKGTHKHVGYGSFLKRLFYDFPRAFAHDMITRNPDEFRDYGFNLICGEQGSGKTVTLVYMLLRFKKEYPRIKIKTNMDFKYQDGEIEHWQDLVFSNNGIYGELDVIDEVQNWFSTNQSRNFPPEMLQEITQQRKQRKMILGTSQVFTRVSKPIRENTYSFYLPFTVFGCLTVVRRYKPILSDDGQLKEKKLRGVFFFVHSQELRNAFDTYKKIEKMAESGFVPRSEQLPADDYTVVQVREAHSKSKKIS